MRAVLDIETLATTPDAVVFEIAAMTYGHDSQPAATIVLELDIAEQLAVGRHLDADTVAFHRRQGTLPERWTGNPAALALANLELFLAGVSELWIWGKDFDRPILDNLFRAHSRAFPVPYFHTHCARDAWFLAFGPDKRPARRAHRALEDVEAIAAALQTALDHLNPAR